MNAPSNIKDLRTDPLNLAIAETIKGLARFNPSVIRGEADPCDVSSLASDLKEIADIIDPLIRAYGDYAAYHTHIPADEIRECFDKVLLGAIDGNATYVIESAAERMNEDRRPPFRAIQPYR